MAAADIHAETPATSWQSRSLLGAEQPLAHLVLRPHLWRGEETDGDEHSGNVLGGACHQTEIVLSSDSWPVDVIWSTAFRRCWLSCAKKSFGCTPGWLAQELTCCSPRALCSSYGETSWFWPELVQLST